LVFPKVVFIIELSNVNYGDGQQWVLQLVLALIVLGIALDLTPADFRRVLKNLRAPLCGLLAQFFILPVVTLFLTLVLDLPPGIELGMLLVAACPGGAISNFITHLSGGNTALSISMTAAASTMAIVMMPFNFVFWSQFNADASALLQEINVSPKDIISTLVLVLAVPLAIGFTLRKHLPALAGKLHVILRYTSVIALFAFIILAVFENLESFQKYFGLLMVVVLIHNGLALLIGYSTARLNKVDVADQKAITIEVGMQNSSLAIAIVFTQFNGEAGMALISAFWGTWHLVSGLLLASVFRRVPNTIGKPV